MTGQVLNSFGIYPSIYQVRDICMPQLVRRHLKVQAVHHLAIMRSLFTENRCDCVLVFLTVHIPHVGAFLIAPCHYILPDALELSVGKRLTISVCDHKWRLALCLYFSKAIS